MRPPAARPDSLAAARMRRALSFSVGAAALLLAYSDYSVFQQFGSGARWWTVAAVAGVVGPAVVLAVGAILLPVAALVAAARVFAWSYFVFLAVVPAAWQRAGLPVGERPWITVITTVGCAAAALCLRPRVVWCYVLLLAPLLAFALWWTVDGAPVLWLVRNGVLSAVLGALFCGLILRALRGAELLDEESDNVISAAADRAASCVRALERSRIDALIHDSVRSALMTIGRHAEPPTRARAAALALRTLDELRDTDRPAAPVAGAELVARLRQICWDLCEDIVFTDKAVGTVGEVPAAVAQALSEVVVEAVRNSLAHAGSPDSPVGRSVFVRAAAGDVAVVVADNGAGFDPAAVPRHRLGIAVGIVATMRHLAGGYAVVDARPGTGTRVTVGWREPRT